MPTMPLQLEYYANTNTWAVRGEILPSTEGTTDGVWHDLQGFCPLSVTVETMAFIGVAHVCVSNQPTKPHDDWPGAPLGSPLDGQGGTRTIDAPYRWVKVRISEYSSGAIEAHAFGYKIGQLGG